MDVQAPELTCVLVMLSAAKERSNQPTKRQKMLFHHVGRDPGHRNHEEMIGPIGDYGTVV